MGLPETIRVKISSEEAGSIALTPVVLREMPVRELIEAMLGAAGKNPERIQTLLRAGSLVAGQSRFRWEAIDADRAALDGVLATFPDPEPNRAFGPAHCVRAVLEGPGARVEIEREAARERRLFRKGCFWDTLMEVAQSAAPQYAGYSYRQRADRYHAALDAAHAAVLREHAGTLRYSTLETRVRQARLSTVELFTEREP